MSMINNAHETNARRHPLHHHARHAKNAEEEGSLVRGRVVPSKSSSYPDDTTSEGGTAKTRHVGRAAGRRTFPPVEAEEVALGLLSNTQSQRGGEALMLLPRTRR